MTAVAPASLTAADIAAVPAGVVERLRAARCVLTVCHENPEADALGSRSEERRVGKECRL